MRRRHTIRACVLAAAFAAGGIAAAATVNVTEGDDGLHASGCALTGQAPCTLRDAITYSNTHPGPDTILFAVGSGPVSIRLTSPLPAVTDPVVIDATKQPGWPGSPIVALDGAGAGDEAAGLRITAGSSAVRGLVLSRFRSAALAAIVLDERGGNVLQGNFVGTDLAGAASPGNRGTGILVRSDRNRIGGTSIPVRNVVSGNTGAGIRIEGAGNVVEGNRVGTDVTGARALGNGAEGIVSTGAGGNTIGGEAAGAGNVVSGNGDVGIAAGPADSVLGNIVGADAGGAVRLPNRKGGIRGGGRIGGTEGVRPEGPCSGACNLVSGNGGPGVSPGERAAVRGNFIGTDAAGTAALPNAGAGVLVSGVARATIGGPSSAAGNLISGNSGPGIEIAFDSEETAVSGNRIGVDATETAGALPNADGVRLRDGARKTAIGGTDFGTDGNHIAWNAGAGVLLEFSAGAGNAILSNSIHDNGALGIDSGGDGVTPNHGPEAGARISVNFPVLTKVTPYSVEGTLDAAPHTGFTLQFFSNASCDPSGYGEGQTQIATWNVTTDAGGHADFGVSLTAPRDQGVAATATSAAAGTSEFSPCVMPEVEEEPGGSPEP
ncbi:MAG TPA: hypothetical protein VIA45_15495 [Thermoanaerobaculia bacterium]